MANDKTQIEEIAVTDIRVMGRTRKLSEDAIMALDASYEALDGFTTPIQVRKAKSGYELIDGLHRLTLAQRKGLPTILSRVWSCTKEQAKFFEVDANLALAHLTPVALARSLAVRQEAYERLHPGTAKGVAGGLARHGQQPTEMSFADFVGAVLGVTPRQVQRIVRAGKSLAPDQASALEDAPQRVTMSDLYDLAKIDNSAERYFVIDALAEGRAKKASAARRLFKADRGEVPPEKSDRTKAFDRLSDAWTRAGRLVQRSWLEANAGEVRALLDEIDGAQE